MKITCAWMAPLGLRPETDLPRNSVMPKTRGRCRLANKNWAVDLRCQCGQAIEQQSVYTFLLLMHSGLYYTSKAYACTFLSSA